MKIRITGALVFNQFFGGPEPVWLEIDHGSLHDVLQMLGRRFGPGFETLVFEGPEKKIKPTNLIMLNGEPYWNLPHRLSSKLSDGDEVRLSPIVTGG